MILLTVSSVITCACAVSGAGNYTEERLRVRIALAWSYFANGNFEAYVTMWSARKRPIFRETEEDWQKTKRNWQLFLDREKPAAEVLDVQISETRARAKMKVSILEKGGSRVDEVVYDYWIFENEDWFLDDAGRTG